METHVRSRSLDLDPQAASPQLYMTSPVKDIRAEIVVIILPAPVRDMGADTTTLRLVPAPVISTVVETTMDPNSEDERTAKAHVYQTRLASAHGKKLR